MLWAERAIVWKKYSSEQLRELYVIGIQNLVPLTRILLILQKINIVEKFSRVNSSTHRNFAYQHNVTEKDLDVISKRGAAFGF